MVKALHHQDPTDNKMPTVVIDGGIATDNNLDALKEHYHYIAVSRKKIDATDTDDYIVIRETNQNKDEAKRILCDDEIFLYCNSHLKRQKESASRRTRSAGAKL
jgi:hypothetical protein